ADGHEPRSRGIEARVAWLARRGRTDAATLRAHGGTGESRLESTGLRRRGRAVALELRHAAGRIRQGTGPAVGTIAAAVLVAACVCARPTGEKIRQDCCAAKRSDFRAPAGEPLGAGMEQRV